MSQQETGYQFSLPIWYVQVPERTGPEGKIDRQVWTEDRDGRPEFVVLFRERSLAEKVARRESASGTEVGEIASWAEMISLLEDAQQGGVNHAAFVLRNHFHMCTISALLFVTRMESSNDDEQ